MKKIKKTPLIKLGFKFYGETVPNVFEVDKNDKNISRPHIEVSKKKLDGSRFFETKIYKAGTYKFSGIKLEKHDPLYLIFEKHREGIFVLDEKRNITIIENK